MPTPPGWQRRSGHLELFGRLTFGEALSAPLSVLFKEVGTFKSSPAGLALRGALLRVVDDGSPSDLLGQSLALE
jgi:hypothetical protein